MAGHDDTYSDKEIRDAVAWFCWVAAAGMVFCAGVLLIYAGLSAMGYLPRRVRNPVPDTCELRSIENIKSKVMLLKWSEVNVDQNAGSVHSVRSAGEGNSQRPTSASFVRSSTSHSSSILDQECCAICLGTFRPEDIVCRSKNVECTHIFHFQCLAVWLTNGKNGCPVCRKNYLEATPPPPPSPPDSPV